MKKIFTFFATALCSLALFSQTVQLETKDGQVIKNGEVVSVKADMDVDVMMLKPHLFVRNLTDKNIKASAQIKVISGNDISICYQACSIVPEGQTSPEKTDLVNANSAKDLQIESFMMDPDFLNKSYSRTVEVSVWNTDVPTDKVTATVTYTYEPSLIESTEVESASVYANGNVLYYSFADATDRQLQVFDVTGHLQKDIRLTSEAGGLSLEGMTKGLYIYRVAEAGKKIVSGKFLVK